MTEFGPGGSLFCHVIFLFCASTPACSKSIWMDHFASVYLLDCRKDPLVCAMYRSSPASPGCEALLPLNPGWLGKTANWMDGSPQGGRGGVREALGFSLRNPLLGPLAQQWERQRFFGEGEKHRPLGCETEPFCAFFCRFYFCYIRYHVEG